MVFDSDHWFVDHWDKDDPSFLLPEVEPKVKGMCAVKGGPIRTTRWYVGINSTVDQAEWSHRRRESCSRSRRQIRCCKKLTKRNVTAASTWMLINYPYEKVTPQQPFCLTEWILRRKISRIKKRTTHGSKPTQHSFAQRSRSSPLLFEGMWYF